MEYSRTVHGAMWPGQLQSRSRNPVVQASAPLLSNLTATLPSRRPLRAELDASSTTDRLRPSLRYERSKERPRRERPIWTGRSQESDDASPLDTKGEVLELRNSQPSFEMFSSAHDLEIASSQFNQVGHDQHIYNNQHVVSTSFPLTIVSLSDPSSWIMLFKQPTTQQSFMTVVRSWLDDLSLVPKDILVIVLPALSTLAANVAYRRYIDGSSSSSDTAGSS